MRGHYWSQTEQEVSHPALVVAACSSMKQLIETIKTIQTIKLLKMIFADPDIIQPEDHLQESEGKMMGI